MCLGGAARTANENARRRYKYENERRERNWMQNISIYNAQKVKYEEDSQNANLAQAYAIKEQQDAMNLAREEAQIKYEELFRKVMSDSVSGKLIASGQTGQSARRRQTLDYAEHGRNVSKIARSLVLNDKELAKQTSAQISKYKQFKDQAFAKVAFEPIKDVAPPQPAMRNVGAEAFMQGLSIAGSVAGAAGGLGFKPLTTWKPVG